MKWKHDEIPHRNREQLARALRNAAELRAMEMEVNTPASWADAKVEPPLNICCHCDIIIMGPRYTRNRKNYHRACFHEVFNNGGSDGDV